MKVKNIIDEDFSNYMKCSMLVGFPTCTLKCEKDCGISGLCQNSELYLSKSIELPVEKIVDRYISNPISSALICGGLEPFDSFDDLMALIHAFRKRTDDDVVIYTGYNREELDRYVKILQKNFTNIIIKFGRFIPNQKRHIDVLLGVELASDNQYAERIC